MLAAAHGVNGRAAVMLRGAVICGNIYFDLDKVLMDTGALHSRYISRDLVDKHRGAWRGKVIRCDGKVRLGDNKTEVNVTERVKIDVVLQAPDQQPVTTTVNFCVKDLPTRLHGISSSHRWEAQHLRLGYTYVHAWRLESMAC
jgi:hypothetical protein